MIQKSAVKSTPLPRSRRAKFGTRWWPSCPGRSYLAMGIRAGVWTLTRTVGTFWPKSRLIVCSIPSSPSRPALSTTRKFFFSAIKILSRSIRWQMIGDLCRNSMLHRFLSREHQKISSRFRRHEKFKIRRPVRLRVSNLDDAGDVTSALWHRILRMQSGTNTRVKLFGCSFMLCKNTAKFYSPRRHGMILKTISR